MMEPAAKPVAYPDGVPIEVCDLFERLALEIKEAGHRMYSARAILHRIRWHYHMEVYEVNFKANNNWTAPMARWAMKKNPELEGFFETRDKAVKVPPSYCEVDDD